MTGPLYLGVLFLKQNFTVTVTVTWPKHWCLGPTSFPGEISLRDGGKMRHLGNEVSPIPAKNNVAFRRWILQVHKYFVLGQGHCVKIMV